MPENDLYKILGIRPTASQKEIELAYRARRTQYHPDKYAQSDEATVRWATAQMQEVNRAYDVLSDEQRRRNYDQNWQSSNDPTSESKREDSPEFEPAGLIDGIILFSLSDSDLESLTYRYMASGNYTPDDMLEAAKITLNECFYVPVYQFPVEYTATWSASFGYDRLEPHTAYRTVFGPRGGRHQERHTVYVTVTDWHPASGIDEGDLTVYSYAGNRLRNLALNPAGLIPEIVSEGEIEEFTSSHVIGFEVEECSVSSSQSFADLRKDINNIIDERVKRHAQGDHQKDWHWSARMQHETITLAVPICHVTFSYGGSRYDVWTSGQNGNVMRATSLPVDKVRQNLVYAGFSPLAAGLTGVGIVAALSGFSWETLISSMLAASYGFARRKSIIDYSKQYRKALLNQLHTTFGSDGISHEERAQSMARVQHPEKPALAKTDKDKVTLPILAIASLLGTLIPGYFNQVQHLPDKPGPMAKEGNSLNQKETSAPSGSRQALQNPVAQDVTLSRAQEQALMRLVGSEPAMALDAPELKERFTVLLGTSQSDFRDNLTISEPISVNGPWLVGAGERPHTAVTEGAIFVINRFSGKVFAAMLAEGKKVSLYGNNNLSAMPPPIQNWYANLENEFRWQTNGVKPEKKLGSADQPAQKSPSSPLLSELVGRPPRSVFEDPTLNGKFKSLLGWKFNSFQMRLATGDWISEDDGWLVGQGGLTTQTTGEEAAFAINAKSGEIFAILLEHGRQFTIFGAKDAGALPEPLKDWYEEHQD